MERVQRVQPDNSLFQLCDVAKKRVAIGLGALSFPTLALGVVGILIGKKIIPVDLKLSDHIIIGISSGLLGLGAIGATVTFVIVKSRKIESNDVHDDETTEPILVPASQTDSPPPPVQKRILDENEEIAEDLWTNAHDSRKLVHWKSLNAAQHMSLPDPYPITLELSKLYESEARDHEFAACGCLGVPKRYEDEKRIITELLQRFPDRNQPIRLLSLGSGHLKPDWILFSELTAIGYKNIHMTFVDPEISEGEVRKFSALAMKESANFTCNFYKNIDQVDLDSRFQCAYGHDFKVIEGSAEDTISGWDTIAKAQKQLVAHGFILMTHLNDYFYDKSNNHWDFGGVNIDENDIPNPADNETFTISMVNLADQRFNLLSILPLLERKGYQKVLIHTEMRMETIYQYRAQSYNNLVKKLFGGSIEVNFSKNEPNTKVDLMVIGVCTADKIAKRSQKLKENGLFIASYRVENEGKLTPYQFYLLKNRADLGSFEQ